MTDKVSPASRVTDNVSQERRGTDKVSPGSRVTDNVSQVVE